MKMHYLSFFFSLVFFVSMQSVSAVGIQPPGPVAGPDDVRIIVEN